VRGGHDAYVDLDSRSELTGRTRCSWSARSR
jgi:hypothetical protein